MTEIATPKARQAHSILAAASALLVGTLVSIPYSLVALASLVDEARGEAVAREVIRVACVERQRGERRHEVAVVLGRHSDGGCFLPLGTVLQPLDHHQQRDGEQDQQRRHGSDGRAQRFANATPHLPR